MYCIKCGVELADGAKKCPLCETKVCHPDFLPDESRSLFPSGEVSNEFSRTGIMFVTSSLFLLAIFLCGICDLAVHYRFVWSDYAIISLLLVYVAAVLPWWFKRPNPVIFVPCDFAATLAFLFFISIKTGGRWFFTLALPATVASALIVCTVVTLTRYLRRGKLYIAGGALIAIGASNMLLEFLIRYTFFDSIRFIWSFYPLITFFFLGMTLIVIAICKPLRRSLEKIFFI